MKIDSNVGFRKKLLIFIKPTENKTYRIYNPLGIKLFNILRVTFSSLKEHKFKYNFADTLNRFMFMLSRNWKQSSRYPKLPKLYKYSYNPYDINNSSTSRQPNQLLRITLYGDCKFKDNVNKLILIAAILFIKNNNRFNQSLI